MIEKNQSRPTGQQPRPGAINHLERPKRGSLTPDLLQFERFFAIFEVFFDKPKLQSNTKQMDYLGLPP